MSIMRKRRQRWEAQKAVEEKVQTPKLEKPVVEAPKPVEEEDDLPLKKKARKTKSEDWITLYKSLPLRERCLHLL